ncbi:glucosyl-3-phosphoglycerate synthase [Iamia majanohamensis]|uniref:Glucosyl-3-phosphoglycerate synthase n=1 Tax=Iamia majanohamensis TaxID=467976 RepID=A0AAE9YAQ5_9ACTN|nr:glucosyl-3-phosphoglycerate synthase [Iamia majanohamensis]WCO67683.1 glucosyl-3-phosphoglycerate synthase [Iamia majanohamensis]
MAGESSVPGDGSAGSDGRPASVGTGVLRTSSHLDHPVEDLVAAKAAQGLTASLVLPARNEEATVAEVVSAYLPLVGQGLVDELVVLDSLSTDRTAARAAAAGARVVHAADVRPELEAVPGKGEALWRSLGATTGDLVAFCDADVLDAGPHFVAGLLGPLLAEPEVALVKGFYQRPILDDDGEPRETGGRVTELTARPLLNLYRPELGRMVQPLAGEWAGRRSLLEALPFPVGYGVEVAVLLDAHERLGLGGLAQVDLGCRTHRRQSQDALGVMAAQVAAAALRRLGLEPEGHAMVQFSPDGHAPRETPLTFVERPPWASLAPVTEAGAALSR